MANQFGGPWTRRKLDVLEEYLKAYLFALSKQRFSLGYVDAFAGDGSIVLASSDDDNSVEIEGLIKGSALRALALEPGFDGYVFIEKDTNAIDRLNKLKQAFPGKRMMIIQGDANEKVGQLCSGHSWKKRRAVIFLDPTGMQVDWSTLEAIASTQAIDVWIWFPLGIGVNRLLTRSGEINYQWQERLDRIFGTPEWREEFYKTWQEHTLFGKDEKTRKVTSTIVRVGRTAGLSLVDECLAAANDQGHRAGAVDSLFQTGWLARSGAPPCSACLPSAVTNGHASAFCLALRLGIEKVVHHRHDDGHALHQSDVGGVRHDGQP